MINGGKIATKFAAPKGSPLEELYSGWRFRKPETQELQAAGFDNPAFAAVALGEELWSTVTGSEGKSCATCHNDASESMKGVRALMPKWDNDLGKPITLEQQINECRAGRMGARKIKFDSTDMLAMSTCQGLIEERDAEISLSPGFRWGTTLLPGQDITMDDLYTQTSMSYPSVYRIEMTGKQLHDILEDVCDNLFNKDPFYQQGGDMVRVGGMSYTVQPKKEIGYRITDMAALKSGKPIDASQKYVVAGWASVNEGSEGPAVYDLMEKYISRLGVIPPLNNDRVKVEGM